MSREGKDAWITEGQSLSGGAKLQHRELSTGEGSPRSCLEGLCKQVLLHREKPLGSLPKVTTLCGGEPGQLERAREGWVDAQNERRKAMANHVRSDREKEGGQPACEGEARERLRMRSLALCMV